MLRHGLTLALGLALGLALAPVSEAQEQEDVLARDLRRVLRLEDGSFLRTRARLEDGTWLHHERGEWKPLSREVLGWRSERELLKIAEERRRAIQAAGLSARTQLAEWLLGEGLVKEAKVELNKVLAADAGLDAAINLVRGADFPLPQFDGRGSDATLYRDLILAGGQVPPLERELIIQRLEAFRERTNLEATFARELVTPRSSRREFATYACGRLLPGKQVKELLRRAVLDVSGEVRAGATFALRAVGEPAMALPLMRALSSEHSGVRTNAAESLGALGIQQAVPVLVAHYVALGTRGAPAASGGDKPPASHIFIGKQFAYVGDFDVEIAQGASIADPQVMTGVEGAVLDVRIGGISGFSLRRELRTTRLALEQLTGEKPGHGPRAWQSWLEQKQAAAKPPSGAGH